MRYDNPILEDYLRKFANWDRLNAIGLTFDVDWAPDFMISNVLDILSTYEIKATFFATHDSSLLRKISKETYHEIGIHPNLDATSTQGNELAEIVHNLRSFYPDVNGCRFHILKMSYRDLLWLGAQGFIKYDVSRILFNAPYLVPAWHQDLRMVLLSYMWEDGVCENQGLIPSLESMALGCPGLKILNFHPMNVYINSVSREERFVFQKEVKNLLYLEEDHAKKFQRQGAGSGNALIELCQYIKGNKIQTYTLHELASGFKKELYGN